MTTFKFITTGLSLNADDQDGGKICGRRTKAGSSLVMFNIKNKYVSYTRVKPQVAQ